MLHNATPSLVTYNSSPDAFAVGMAADYTAERGGGSTADYWEGVMGVHREQQLAVVRAAAISALTEVRLAADYASVDVVPPVSAFPEQPLF